MPRVKKMREIKTMDYFIVWIASLIKDIRETILVARAFIVYDSNVYFKTPACWVVSCFHLVVILITPQMKWYESATVEMLSYHISANFLLMGLWMMFSYFYLRLVEDEPEEIKKTRVSVFLRRHGVECGKTVRKLNKKNKQA
jgi:hypothetical protein